MSMIAVLMTCHDRKVQTIACLERLFSQVLPSTTTLKVYLVDDGCTDGTANAVNVSFPSLNLIAGTGNLFWCQGMRLAWEHAAKDDPDFYLWLNDDTLLRAGAIKTFIRIAEAAHNPACIVVGSCCDAVSGELTYGGQRLLGKHPARLLLVEPDPVAMKTCDTFNGNCVLVTRAAFQKLGIMRPFRHSIGDTDYGLQALRHRIPVLLAPGFLADCSSNGSEGSWRDLALPRAMRMRLLTGRKGLPPTDWWRFLWYNAGFRAFIYWPIPYLRVLVGR